MITHDRTTRLITEALESELINSHSADTAIENNTPSILRMPLLAVARERWGLLIVINRSEQGPNYKQYGTEKSILGHVLQCEWKVKRLWNSQVKMMKLSYANVTIFFCNEQKMIMEPHFHSIWNIHDVWLQIPSWKLTRWVRLFVSKLVGSSDRASEDITNIFTN